MLTTVAVGCDGLAVDDYSNLPPCVDSYCDCGDFVSRDLAQDVFDAFKEDFYSLDRDGNGQACESLPQVVLSLKRATECSNNVAGDARGVAAQWV